jgi:hypothetical protein
MSEIEVNKDHYLDTDFEYLNDMPQESSLPKPCSYIIQEIKMATK